MQTNPATEQNKNAKSSESPWIQSGRREKGPRRKGFAEEPSLKFRMKDWTSKRRWKWWSWRRWRTDMCDRWKWRRLYLTKFSNKVVHVWLQNKSHDNWYKESQQMAISMHDISCKPGLSNNCDTHTANIQWQSSCFISHVEKIALLNSRLIA